jgi:hypothetical protein
MRPYFVEGKYFEGIFYSVLKIEEALGRNIVNEDYKPKDKSGGIGGDLLIFGLWLFIVLIRVIISFMARSKSWWQGGQ